VSTGAQTNTPNADAVSGARTLFVASGSPIKKATPAKLQKQAVWRNASLYLWAREDSNNPRKHGENAIHLLREPFL